jgi:3'-phosphoadenosine 5'-phosphosulfate sulfotransferase (PAPS reductase)/FAD synthetase
MLNLKKKITKSEMIFEQNRGRDRGITDFARWFEPRERRILNAYLIKLRDSGLENMFGVAPILNWTKDDLHRYLYGKRMDLESLESHGDYEDYWDGDEDDDTERNDELIEIIRYLLEKKQEIRDILIRAALRRAEADGGEYSDSRITSYFHRAANDALRMYMASFG